MLQGKTTLLSLGLVGLMVAGCAHSMPTGKSQASNGMGARGALTQADAHADTPCEHDMDAQINMRAPQPKGLLIPFALSSREDLAPRPEMISMPSPNKSGRGGQKIDTLVIHHTSSSANAERIGGFFSQPSAKVSSHYVVGQDGHIVFCVPESESSWHAGKSTFMGKSNVNAFSVGIEICNLGDGKDPYSDAQYKALSALVAYILTNDKIKWGRVTGHKDVAIPKGRKNDPSINFSYDRMKSEVAAIAPNAGF